MRPARVWECLGIDSAPHPGRYYIVRNNLAMDFEFNQLVRTPLQPIVLLTLVGCNGIRPQLNQLI